MTALTLTSASRPGVLSHLLWELPEEGPPSTQLSPTPFLWLWVSLWEDRVGPKLRVPPPSSQGMWSPSKTGLWRPSLGQWGVRCGQRLAVSGGVVLVGL